jgi:vacuolar-type H+-ATPase subunit H
LAIYIETRISELDMSDLGKAEILQKIKDAEEQVRVTIREAEERRKQLQAEGKRLALQKVEAAGADLRKKLDSETLEARKRVGAKRKELLEEGRRNADALSASARARMRDAKGFVLTEFERAVDA